MNRLITNNNNNDWSHQIESDKLFLDYVSQFSNSNDIPVDQIKLKLDKIRRIEDNVAEMINRKRSSSVLTNDIRVKQKIFRVFIHFKYYSAGSSSTDNKAHFILWIDGVLLDNKNKYKISFSEVFSKVRLQTDKRASPVPQVFEWNKNNGHKSGIDGFRVKIYADKLCLVKISLFRDTSKMERFDVSDSLRAVLPSIRPDPTLDEILLSIWQYIQRNNLFGEKDKRVVRCDDLLRGLFQSDTVNIQNLRDKLSERLSICKPITIDHYLNPVETTGAEYFQ